MLAGLLATAREIRFPLTVGYALLLTVWVSFGDFIEAAARRDPLGSRLLIALDSLGGTAELGVYTFAAAMVGSVAWNGALARFVRQIAIWSGHPDWQRLVDDARERARLYGEYQVLTYKGQSGSRPAMSDVKHTVPSREWGTQLLERVQERERRAAEVSFRITLAISIIPVSIALSFRGGGLWWLTLLAVPAIWLDIALLKYSTLREVDRYALEDLVEKRSQQSYRLDQERRHLAELSTSTAAEDRKRQAKRVSEAEGLLHSTEAAIHDVEARTQRRAYRLFSFIQGSEIQR